MPTLDQLRKQKAKLIKQKKDLAEKRKLLSEIKELKGVKPTKGFKGAVKSFGRKTKLFLKKRADVINENLDRIQREEAKARKKKKKRKGPTHAQKISNAGSKFLDF